MKQRFVHPGNPPFKLRQLRRVIQKRHPSLPPPPQLPHSRWGLGDDINCSHSSLVTLKRPFLMTWYFRNRPGKKKMLLFTSFSKKQNKTKNSQHNPPTLRLLSSVNRQLKIQTQAQWFLKSKLRITVADSHLAFSLWHSSWSVRGRVFHY